NTPAKTRDFTDTGRSAKCRPNAPCMGARLVNYTELGRRFRAAQADVQRGRFARNPEIDALVEGLRERHVRPEDFSIRALFETFVEDGRELVATFNPRYQGHGVPLLEAGGAVSTSHFSNITGQIVYTR